ncbi:replication initiator protein A, partial [Ventosimonas gracilis]|uniref:replication initiator protein A n=1 Tax=Ventosimonas gracilis TaxID=1680762 RepID=UPI0018731288
MLKRLAGTRIETNIAIKGYRAREGFGLVDLWRVVERDGDERMVAVEVTLPEWVFASIESMQVLTLDSNYYRIRSALDRRIYELARKHCGKQPSWTVSMKTLYEKSGSASLIKK